MSNYFTRLDDDSFLLEFAGRLRSEWGPARHFDLPEDLQREVLLLEELSKRNNRVYSIFDRERFEFVFHTWNLFALAGLPEGKKWEITSTRVLQDQGIVKTFVTVMLQVAARLSPEESRDLRSCVCGAYTRNLKGELLRLHYTHHPFTFDVNGLPVLSLGSVADVKSLMTAGEGFWMYFKAGEKSFHWHSHKKELVAKDIVTAREKEIIALWRSGLSIPEIAEKLYISVVTVKNQLHNARKRLMVRDNTALAELCYATGIIKSII